MANPEGTKNTIDLGMGRFVINHGYIGARAALFIEPAPLPGEVGADASASGLNQEKLVEGGIAITFGNLASCEVLQEQISAAMKLIGARPRLQHGTRKIVSGESLV